MAEPIIDSVPARLSEPKKLTRRGFIRNVALVTGALFGLDKLGGVAIDTALTDSTKNMLGLTPPEFEHVTLPEKNDYYRSPETILHEAFVGYNVRRGRDASLAHLHFQRRENYLDLVSLSKKVPRAFEKNDALTGDMSFDKSVAVKLMQIIYGVDNDHFVNNQVEGDAYTFSTFSIDGIYQLLQYDPGSGLVGPEVARVINKYGYTRKEYYTRLNDGKLTGDDIFTSQKHIAERLAGATAYFQKKRTASGEPLSTSVAIEYFLVKNSGDIYASLWDATLYFKLFSRNNLTTLRTELSPAQAKKLAHLFKDEFSPRMSFNWLMDEFKDRNIPDSSTLYAPSAFDTEEYKNFMPINRDGGYYHAFNILTWAAVCMDPAIVKDIVLAYYNEENLGGLNHKTEHGNEKVDADIRVALHADQIQQQVTLYEK